MKLTITRLHDDGTYKTVVARGDGVSYQVKGVAHKFAIPHDLAHFVVEKTLGLDKGFWGSIAEGAVFKSMSYIGGRRKPKAAERSELILKSNANWLNDAEALVRIFNDTFEQGHDDRSPALVVKLQTRLRRPAIVFRDFTARELSDVYAAYQDMLLRWRTLQPGSMIELQ
jgi:hypothetical protein